VDNLSIYFWEPSVSPHKSALFNALGADPRVSSTTYIAQIALGEDRLALGWAPGPVSRDKLILYESDQQVEKIISNSPEDSIHVFSGIHWVPCIVKGISSAIRHHRRFGLMSEPRANDGIRGMLRLVHSWSTEWRIRRDADFVLAIGRHGPPWFLKAGYKAETIFPFAYFLSNDHQAFERTAEVRTNSVPQISFVGRLTKDKGFEDFLKAISLVKSPVRINVAGAGPSLNSLHEAMQKFQNITYLGVLPMNEVPALLKETDVLVSPSVVKDDGWGAVVSEALMAGAAVVASECVGSSICLDDLSRGRVIKASSFTAIASAIDDLVAGGFLDGVYRRERASWAASHLTGVVGARYFLEILEHVYSHGEKPKPFYDF